jgi:hypothetical protein
VVTKLGGHPGRGSRRRDALAWVMSLTARMARLSGGEHRRSRHTQCGAARHLSVVCKACVSLRLQLGWRQQPDGETQHAPGPRTCLPWPGYRHLVRTGRGVL